jgi:ethanolamine permease
MPGPKRSLSGVTYEDVEPSYLAQRGLRRYARVLHLWALGVGAVISGEFYGWNYGLEAGGFWGLFAATVVITIMYVGLVYSIAEMSAALPHTGAAYSFARSSMGPWGAYVTGLAENMEYILTPAVVVVGIGGYPTTLVPGVPPPAWWALAYLVFTGLNIWGVEISFRFTVLVTLIAIGVLGLFYVAAVPQIDFVRYALSVARPTDTAGSSRAGSAGSSRRCPSRSGSSWPSRSCRWRRRSRRTHDGTSLGESSSGWERSSRWPSWCSSPTARSPPAPP